MKGIQVRNMLMVLAAGVLIVPGGGGAVGGGPPGREGRVVVAADGSGAYRSVQAAMDTLPSGGAGSVTLQIKPGTYHERLEVPRDPRGLRLRGEDAGGTVLTFDRNATSLDAQGRPLGTMRSSSTTVRADDFTAEDLTFANATPRDVAQAVALAARGDRQVFRRCRFVGWQDTLYVGEGRHYFEDCTIEGGVDFIFGPGTAVFRNCEIRSKRHGPVTAASTPRDVAHGFVFLDCRFTASADLPARCVQLGRPWRDYASVTLLRCTLGPHIHPDGWSIWKGTERHRTARYAEYGGTGPGAAPAARVPWSRQLGVDEAKALTVRAVLGGADGWDPAAGKSENESPKGRGQKKKS